MADLDNKDCLINTHAALQSGNKAVINWVNLHYLEFQAWLGANNCPPAYLQISSYGKRLNKEGKYTGAHGVNLAIDVARYYLSKPIELQYLLLFAFFLQSKNNNLCHVSLSSWNKHIHIDALASRRGWNRMEYEYTGDDGKLHYDFKTLDKELLMSQYGFKRKIIAGVETDKMCMLADNINADYSVFDPAIDTAKSGINIIKWSIFGLAFIYIYSKLRGK